jgi:hypothetical protein
MMQVVTFDPNQYNLLIEGEDEKIYFLFQQSDNEWLLLNDRCQHKGGPLHLGSWNDVDQCLVCPWHGTKHSKKALQKRAIPIIYRKDVVTAIIDLSPNTSIRFSKRITLVNQ